jgi:hypothetical protein
MWESGDARKREEKQSYDAERGSGAEPHIVHQRGVGGGGGGRPDAKKVGGGGKEVSGFGGAGNNSVPDPYDLAPPPLSPVSKQWKLATLCLQKYFQHSSLDIDCFSMMFLPCRVIPIRVVKIQVTFRVRRHGYLESTLNLTVHKLFEQVKTCIKIR